MQTTPPSLLERLRQSDEQLAWAEFVDLYTPLLFHWALRLGMQEGDAADLVQEVFVVLYLKLPSFTYDARKGFRNWLRTVLLNKWRDHQKRAALPLAGGPEALEGVSEPGGQDDFGEEEYRQYLATRALEIMKAEFEETTWKACWEHVVEDRPVAAVAAELGLSVNAVYLAKSRVLRRLRQELDGLLD